MKKISQILAVIIILISVAFVVFKKQPIPIDVLKKKYTNHDSKFFEYDGMQVHYKILGDGKPILLLHGTSGCIQSWNDWVDSLINNNNKVIVLDIPAYGLTGPNKSNNYTTTYYMDFFDKFVKHIQIDSFAIAGVSLGGEFAWRFALAHPEHVTKLILIDPAGFYNNKVGNTQIVMKIISQKWLANILTKLDTKFLVNNGLKEVFYDDTKISDYKRELYYDMSLREGNRESFVKRVQQDDKKASDISIIKAPTLLMWGKQDNLLEVSLAENYKRIPNLKTIIYNECGHNPAEEKPMQTVSDAITFLKQ